MPEDQKTEVVEETKEASQPTMGDLMARLDQQEKLAEDRHTATQRELKRRIAAAQSNNEEFVDDAAIEDTKTELEVAKKRVAELELAATLVPRREEVARKTGIPIAELQDLDLSQLRTIELVRSRESAPLDGSTGRGTGSGGGELSDSELTAKSASGVPLSNEEWIRLSRITGMPAPIRRVNNN